MIYTLMFAVTPATVTSLFAYSIEHRVWGGNMVYIVMVGIGVVAGFYTLMVRDPDASKEKQSNDSEC